MPSDRPAYLPATRRHTCRDALRHGAGAFSLVELLVVISVIVVLAAMLLPAISLIKGAAVRTTCANSLRQLGATTITWSGENDGVVYLSYENFQAYNSFLVANEFNHNKQFGLLWSQDLIDNPRLLFCSAEKRSGFSFNTTGNPWPHVNNTWTTSGYANRPAWHVDKRFALNAQPAGISSPPLLRNYNRRAILSDFAYEPGVVASRHRSGVNVCYGDGHVSWFDTAKASNSWKAIPPGLFWQNTYNSAITGLWTSFDSDP